MRRLGRFGALAAPMPMDNIDTDQILPKQFLTTLTRSGLGAGLFYDLRFDETGAPQANFVLNRPIYRGAAILIVGENFGCGSSREHAAWALADFGIRSIIAPSFGDIFQNNCLNNGILPIRLSASEVGLLLAEALGGDCVFSIDLELQTLTSPSGKRFAFEVTKAGKRKLLEGLDDIALSLRYLPAIEAFERERSAP